MKPRTWTWRQVPSNPRSYPLCGFLEEDDGTSSLIRIGTLNVNNLFRRGTSVYVDSGTDSEWKRFHSSGLKIPEAVIPTTSNFWQSKDKKSVVLMQNTSMWTWWLENQTCYGNIIKER